MVITTTKWKQINLRLPQELLKTIDEERGLIPRNAWLVAKLTDGDPVNQLMDDTPPKDVRSPEPQPESAQPREPEKPEKAQRISQARAIIEQPRPIVQKR